MSPPGTSIGVKDVVLGEKGGAGEAAVSGQPPSVGFEQGCVPASALPRSLLAPFLPCTRLAGSVPAVLAALPDPQAGGGTQGELGLRAKG